SRCGGSAGAISSQATPVHQHRRLTGSPAGVDHALAAYARADRVPLTATAPPSLHGSVRARGTATVRIARSSAWVAFQTVAFARAGAVVSMFVQQAVGGTIEGSRILLTSVFIAAIGATLTAWFVHHPPRR